MKVKFKITIEYTKEFDSDWYRKDIKSVTALKKEIAKEYDNNTEVLFDDLVNHKTKITIKV